MELFEQKIFGIGTVGGNCSLLYSLRGNFEEKADK